SAPGEGGPPPARGAVLGQLASAPGDQDFYSFTLQAGESATLALKALGVGSVDLELQDADRTRLALGRGGPANRGRPTCDFVAQAAGTCSARVTGTPGTAYNLVVTRDAAFDTEPNNDFLSGPAQQLVLSPAGQQAALGHVGEAPGPDLYQVALSAGQQV